MIKKLKREYKKKINFVSRQYRRYCKNQSNQNNKKFNSIKRYQSILSLSKKNRFMKKKMYWFWSSEGLESDLITIEHALKQTNNQHIDKLHTKLRRLNVKFHSFHNCRSLKQKRNIWKTTEFWELSIDQKKQTPILKDKKQTVSNRNICEKREREWIWRTSSRSKKC